MTGQTKDTLTTPPRSGEEVSPPPRPQQQPPPAMDESKHETSKLAAKSALVRQKVLSVSEKESEAWQRTIDNVVRSVVSVRFCQPCSFETSSTRSSQASGFIVDAEKGYILTNRHVVGAGPFWGHVVFSNQEEVDAYPVYRDPIHDFGILRFDPKAVKYMDIKSLQLRPDLAKVGAEIRVIGNDAGEKLSILSGFISRLDRNAPQYGGYRDFNTCYYQANAAATGGSSGSPVINVDGYAIALQAGGRIDKASTDFFLPLHGPLQALQHIQQGKPIKRGDIQCTFLLRPFDECRRLGLAPEWETAVRQAFPQNNNMLVAESVLPNGPSDDEIEEGDILVKVNGDLVAEFLALDDVFDTHVGQTVRILVQRGGKDIEVDVLVKDIASITPDRFLSVAGGIFHHLPYQLATRYSIPCKGVYVCESGLFDIPDRNGLVLSIDYKPTPDLDTFIDVMKSIPDKARTVVSYKRLNDRHTLRTCLFTINRHWTSKMKMVTRNDLTGVWDFEILGDALPPKSPTRSKARFNGLKYVAHRAVANIVRSFVHVNCKVPFWIDGIDSKDQAGMGVVVDADKGLVLVSREVVPHSLCDIFLTIADSIFVEGKVVFLHPSQNYAILEYDPKLVDAPVQSVSLSTERATQGASTLFIGYNDERQMFYAPTIVTGTNSITFSPATTPRYRPLNMEGIMVDTSLGDQCDSGVLMTMDGTVQAFWLSYDSENFGLGTPSVLPIINQMRKDIVPRLRILPVELETIALLQARDMGVSTEWIEKAEEHSPQHQLFIVKRVFGDDSDEDVDKLIEGDVLLSLNGEVIGSTSELDAIYWHETLDAVILRQGKELTMKLNTIVDDDMETSHIVHLCGAILQRPHRSVRQQIKDLPSEVYVAGRYYGAPASQYGLWTTYFITHVNHDPTPTLESIVSRTRDIPDNTYFRIKGVKYDDSSFVITLKKNERFFPTVEWLRDPEETWRWRWRTYEGGEVIDGDGKYGIWI